MKLYSTAVACLGLTLAAYAQVSIGDAAGWLESAYVEWTDSGADSYNVYYSGAGKSNVKIDSELIRKYGSKVRADVVGLKAGDYTLKVVPVKGGKEQAAATTKTLSVKAHDRAGFAFAGGRVPGGYNADGTLKDGAVVLYVSESTKNKVSLDVVTNAKGTTTACVGLQNIFYSYKKGLDTRPLVIRLLGNVTDPDTLEGGDIVIENKKNAQAYVTFEGVGNDATANGWGIRLKNASNVEVRNIGIMNVNSSEGDDVGLQQDNDHIWVHNVDFFYGDAGSDADQAKGDGALDCKKSTYVTFSYNHFWDNGKSNLLGLKEGTTEGLYITYHHNWYDHSDSRHPRVRYYSAHVYNNYYDGNAKYGAGSTLGSSVFMEGNYFRNCKYPMLTSMQGSDLYAGGTTRNSKNGTFSSEAGGTIKAFNNYMEGEYTFIPYGSKSYKVKGKETTAESQGINTSADFDAYVVTDRNAKVPNTVKSYDGGNTYNNFDTDNSVMYKYNVEEPAAAKASVIKYAGRVQGGSFKWKFNNAVDDASADVNKELKAALVAYKGSNGVVPEYEFSAEDPKPVDTGDGKDSVKTAKDTVTAAPDTAKTEKDTVKAEEPAKTEKDSAKVEKDTVKAVPDTAKAEKDTVKAEEPAKTEKDSVKTEGKDDKKKDSDGIKLRVPASSIIRYVACENRLEIGSASILHLDAVGLGGRRIDLLTVKGAAAGTSVDLRMLKSGAYIIRLVTPDGEFRQTIVKK